MASERPLRAFAGGAGLWALQHGQRLPLGLRGLLSPGLEGLRCLVASEFSGGQGIDVTGDGEGRGVERRFIAKFDQMGVPRGGLELRLGEQGFALNAPKDVDRLIGDCRGLGAQGAVFIDTLANACLGVDENSSNGMGEVMGAAARIAAATGWVVILLHHTEKSGHSMRGSSAVRARADFIVRIRRQGGHIQVAADKLRDEPSGALVASLGIGTRSLGFHSIYKDEVRVPFAEATNASTSGVPNLLSNSLRAKPKTPSQARRDAESIAAHLVARGGETAGSEVRDWFRGQRPDLSAEALRQAISRAKSTGIETSLFDVDGERWWTPKP